MRKDPDPFDERHPSRTDPDCELGRMLKLLFRKDHFMTRVSNMVSVRISSYYIPFLILSSWSTIIYATTSSPDRIFRKVRMI